MQLAYKKITATDMPMVNGYGVIGYATDAGGGENYERNCCFG